MSEDHKRAVVLYGALGLLILLTVYNSFFNQRVMTGHEAFFSDVRAFMNKGGRNTAAQGAKRDARLARIERYLGLADE